MQITSIMQTKTDCHANYECSPEKYCSHVAWNGPHLKETETEH